MKKCKITPIKIKKKFFHGATDTSKRGPKNKPERFLNAKDIKISDEKTIKVTEKQEVYINFGEGWHEVLWEKELKKFNKLHDTSVTPDQFAIILGKMLNMRNEEAAAFAGAMGTKKQLDNIAWQAMRNTGAKEFARHLFDLHGLTPDAMAKDFDNILKAQRENVANTKSAEIMLKVWDRVNNTVGLSEPRLSLSGGIKHEIKAIIAQTNLTPDDFIRAKEAIQNQFYPQLQDTDIMQGIPQVKGITDYDHILPPPPDYNKEAGK